MLLLRLIMILGVFFMFLFSKLGVYLLLLLVIAGNCLFFQLMLKAPFWGNFTITMVLGSIAFELLYPIIFSSNESSFYAAKREFVKAHTEFKRRKSRTNSIEQ